MSFSYNPVTDILTLYGVDYSMEVFRTLGIAQVGTWVRLDKREGSEITVTQAPKQLSAEFDRLLKAIR